MAVAKEVSTLPAEYGRKSIIISIMLTILRIAFYVMIVLDFVLAVKFGDNRDFEWIALWLLVLPTLILYGVVWYLESKEEARIYR